MLPPNQSGVAQSWMNLIEPLAAQGQQAVNSLGQSPAQWAYPYVQQAAQQIWNNPYQSGPVQGGQAAADIFSNQMMPFGQSAASRLGNIGTSLYSAIPSVSSLFSNPAYGRAAQTGAALSPQYAAAVPQVMAQAFDPQQALYNRTLQQVMDQTGAGLAATGTGSSPYGASVLGNTASNFNIDWQNQLLNRMGQGAQTAEGLGASALSSLLDPVKARAAGAALAASALQGLGSGAAGAYGSGAAQLGNLISAAPGAYGAPYSAYNAVQNANLGAMQNEIGLGNSIYQLPQQSLADLMQYMGLGQAASSLASSIGAQNFGQGMQTAAGLGQLGALGLNAFGGGGGGLLGAGSILGSQGPLFGTAADLSIAAGGPPLAAGGLPSFLAPAAALSA
jgi:hypothetical protein